MDFLYTIKEKLLARTYIWMHVITTVGSVLLEGLECRALRLGTWPGDGPRKES
jgi:hypothetical protein